MPGPRRIGAQEHLPSDFVVHGCFVATLNWADVWLGSADIYAALQQVPEAVTQAPLLTVTHDGKKIEIRIKRLFLG